MFPLVSVIITTYKGADTIERSIQSVFEQTYANIEIFVIDDNGKNSEEQKETEKIVSKYPNVKYIPHEKNINGSAARNTGARLAKGKYLAFLDDDDEILPNKIKVQVEMFDTLSEEYGLVYNSYREEFSNGEVREEIATQSGKVLLDRLLDRVKIATSAFMVKRDVYEKLQGFDESFWRHQDWEFVARLSAEYLVKAIPEIGVVKHSIQRNSPQNVEKAEEYRLHYMDKMRPLISQFSKKEQDEIYCYNYLAFTVNYLKKGRVDKVIKYMYKSGASLLFLKLLTFRVVAGIMK